MRNLLILALAVFVMYSCGNTEANSNDEAENASVMTVDDLLAEVESLVDQSVAIEGTVTHVCKHGGKRLHLIGADETQKIKVEAGDEIAQFERELEGSDIVVYGVVKEERVDEAYLAEWEQEVLAEQAANEETTTEEGAGTGCEGEHNEEEEPCDEETKPCDDEATAGTEDDHEHHNEVDPSSHNTPAMEQIAQMREEVANSEKGYISFYSVVCEKIETKPNKE